MKIDRKILNIKFACDLSACKAACCTFPGGSGPSVLDSERSQIEKAWNLLKDRVPLPHRQLVDRDGLFTHENGSLTIRCFDERACVFVVYDKGIARCSIQQAAEAGELSWPKPLSCHLFPIRIRGKGKDQLRFEHFPECDPALELGEQLDMPLVDFVRDALIRAFGRDTYQIIRKQINHQNNKGDDYA